MSVYFSWGRPLDPAPEALGLENEPPVEAMNEKARRKYFNR